MIDDDLPPPPPPRDRPRRGRPLAHEEVARVLHIYDMLGDELPDPELSDAATLLAVAERIAARTEGL